MGPTDRAGIRGLIELLLALFAVPLLDGVWPANLLIGIALATLAFASFREFVGHQSWALPTAVRVRVAFLGRPHRATAMVSLAIAAFIFLGSVSASILTALRARLGSGSGMTTSVRMVQGAVVADGATAAPSLPSLAATTLPSTDQLGESGGTATPPVASQRSPVPTARSTSVPIVYVTVPRDSSARPSTTPVRSSSSTPGVTAGRPPSPGAATAAPAVTRPSSSDDRAYVERVIPLMETVQAELDVAAGQGDLLRRDPSLSSNGAWRGKTEASLARLRVAGGQLQHVGPVPPGMAGVDAAVTGFGQSLVAVARDYTRVIDTGDASHLSVAEADVSVAVLHLRAVIAQLQAAEATYGVPKG